MPKLSIVIPVYNMERYLRACLDSCLDLRRAAEYEIVAVNDGSTDSSRAILAEYEARFPKLLRALDTPNGGLGHARNVGLEAARGDWLAFVDSDDTLAPGAVAEMLDAVDCGADILIFDFLTVDESGRLLETTRGCGREGCFTLREYPELLFDPPNACNKLWRRALFADSGIRFPGRVWFEDLATVPKLYPLAETLCYLPRGWYRYLQRGGSIMHASRIERNLEIIPAVDAVLAAYRAAGLYGRYEPQLCYLAFYHQLLTSTTRVNLLNPASPVQDALLEDYLKKFPDFRENPYIRALGAKYRLLLHLILHRQRRALHRVMRANEIVKRRKLT